ncbi:phosphate ABC transporter permease [Aliidiomarina iranensis]|uniref:Phosphate ABC transporter permease n=1 Tax=Aliidiomarina iranensis TaxID=1434071 RepID=A0A432VVD5_9GAMM|nr:ABC transporter permease subunit [Aliidiomarina iranensis]RUO20455.1 phosphate ABC transporter permease [Aliidiomarina iranensis]
MAMSKTSSQFSAGRTRLIKDRAARFGVTLGGGLVLIALLLIFFYLLYVVLPIFKSASIEEGERYAIPGSQAETILLGMEARAEVGYRVTADGRFTFFHLRTLDSERQGGEVLLESNLANTAADVTAVARASQATGDYAVGFDDGSALVIRPEFQITYPNDVRSIEPSLTKPYGEEPVVIDPQGAAIKHLAFERDGDSMMFAALTADNRIVVNRLTGRQNMMTRRFTWSSQGAEIPVRGAVGELLLTPNLRQLMVQVNGSGDQRVHIFNLQDMNDISESQIISTDGSRGAITSLALLAGESSLMIGHDSGYISQWFEVSGDGERQFQPIRSFNLEAPVADIVPEQYRRSFYAVAATGEVGIYHTTSQRELFKGSPAGVAIEQVAVGPRANYLAGISDGELHIMVLNNEHPEVSWSGIWGQVWYENYDEPGYTWQSTSGSDSFEPKFSLVPISFGTIKAAFYAMLIAVPIGLAAAVYTAYFMTPALRKVVKPTIEIMEALPTVILGFLAGLWLAPLIENQLPGFIAFMLLLPLSILLAAFAWHLMPKNIRNKVTDGRAAMLLIPVVLLVGWGSFAMSSTLELWFFEGDTRGYLTNTLGIDFDQRNALIVGIAMGFAVIPTIFSIAEDAVFSVPKHLSSGSLALGATDWQTLTRVVLLTASPGIFSAVMMGLGRAVGETMIVLMATGNTPIMDWNIFEGMRTLSANIAVEMPESEVGSTHYRILFLAAFVLFVFTFAFNTVAEFVRQRLREKYSSM